MEYKNWEKMMSISTKYDSLLSVLDAIRYEAPEANRRYNPDTSNIEKVNNARSRSFLHLYLKVKYGELDFIEREHFVTDGGGDGGIDAYYIDNERRRILIFQAKFCTTESNFEAKQITLDELLSIEVDRILAGETHDESGTKYNGKIKQFQREVSEVPDIGRFSYEVILLANLKTTRPARLRKFADGCAVTVFNFEKTYEELVFPVVSGTYYNEPELRIRLNLTNTTSQTSMISYAVHTSISSCDVTLLFVPTGEVARIMYKYRNSILKYNPRSFLELSKNDVNKDISASITEIETNEFALFNNGITMLSDETDFNRRMGAPDKAQVIVTNPQIINGGQTAYTLSRIYEDQLQVDGGEQIFDGKEVLLKIITFDSESENSTEQKLEMIEAISKATNSQTVVTLADRRANDKLQIQLQKDLFSNYGYYYERKRGEFADGLRYKYIKQKQVIDREILLRIGMACALRISEARGKGEKTMFKEQYILDTYGAPPNVPELFYAYSCYNVLSEMEKNRVDFEGVEIEPDQYGKALLYGKYAVVAVCTSKSTDYDTTSVEKSISEVLSKWVDYEKTAFDSEENQRYFKKTIDEDSGDIVYELNYSNYYKGRTINNDIRAFFEI